MSENKQPLSKFDFLIEPLILALGTRNNLTELINKLYEEISPSVQKIARQELRDDIMQELIQANYLNQYRKAYTIVTNDLSMNSNKNIIAMIKKGFSELYRFVTQNKRITHDDVIRNVTKRKPMHELSEFELSNMYAVLNYLFVEYKDIRDVEASELLFQTQNTYRLGRIRALENSIDHNSELDTVLLYKARKVAKEDAEKSEETLRKLLVKKEFNTNYALDYLIDREHEKLVGFPTGQLYNMRDGSFLTETKLDRRGEVFSLGETSSLIGFINTITKLFGFYPEKMQDIALTEYESNVLIRFIQHMYYENHLDKNYKIEDLFVVSIYLITIIKEAKNTQQLYKDLMLEEAEMKIDSLYQKQIERMKNQIQKSEATATKAVQKVQTLEEQNKTANAEIKALRKQLAEQEKLNAEIPKMKQELHSLREFAYNTGDDDVSNIPFADVSIDAMIEAINTPDTIIVGGHVNWQNKMKARCSDINYIDVDKTGSFSAISNKGKTVFINTKTNNHGNYYKLIRSLHPENTLIYINDHVNIELSIRSIYKEMSDRNLL